MSKTKNYLDMNGKRVTVLGDLSKLDNIMMTLNIGYTCKHVLSILRIASTAGM